MQLQVLAVLALTLIGFALRLNYLVTSHPFFDEYTTVLAAKQVLKFGWPVLPSGLFYEHGLLSTYLIAPFAAFFVNMPVSAWQPAHWSLMLARWPSTLIGTVTIPLIYAAGHRLLPKSPVVRNAALFAAGLFALSPEGVVWGGRARMYAPATLLVLLAVYWAYRGSAYPAPAKYRWLTLTTMLALLLTQFGALILIPPLVVGMLVVGWQTHRQQRAVGANTAAPVLQNLNLITAPVAGRSPFHAPYAWFQQKAVLLEGIALLAITGFAILVKRLGQPVGLVELSQVSGDTFFSEFIRTVSYQVTFYFTWSDTITFLARQFGVPHHFWLMLATIAGAVVGVGWWWTSRRQSAGDQEKRSAAISRLPFFHPFNRFLWLILGLTILEMVTLLEPFRRNPRYLVMLLPLFYLIAAYAIFNLSLLFRLISKPTRDRPFTPHSALRTPQFLSRPLFLLLFTLILLAVFTLTGLNDLRIALITPEPAYQEAFAKIRAEWQPGDAVITMNTPAAALYLEQVDGFSIQNDAEQFLLETGAGPVDRWLGAPWVGTAAELRAVLSAHPRTWFVIDTIRLPVYFRGDWLAVINTQMDQVWSGDNALVYRTGEDRTPLPTQPATMLSANFDHSINLIGYTLDPPTPAVSNPQLDVTLFWQPQQPLGSDYTIFLHLRNAEGVTMAQRDRQPLDGAYPTSQWQPGETVIDSITLPLPEDLPAGNYRLVTGLYRLDTLARLPVINDTSGENAVVLGEVAIEQP